jgi:hypothetical protein
MCIESSYEEHEEGRKIIIIRFSETSLSGYSSDSGRLKYYYSTYLW